CSFFYSCPFFLFLLYRSPSILTLFPYTTLFRSQFVDGIHRRRHGEQQVMIGVVEEIPINLFVADGLRHRAIAHIKPVLRQVEDRSEEHTSELQSRENLVCRLLLEKKNQNS